MFSRHTIAIAVFALISTPFACLIVANQNALYSTQAAVLSPARDVRDVEPAITAQIEKTMKVEMPPYYQPAALQVTK